MAFDLVCTNSMKYWTLVSAINLYQQLTCFCPKKWENGSYLPFSLINNLYKFINEPFYNREKVALYKFKK